MAADAQQTQSPHAFAAPETQPASEVPGAGDLGVAGFAAAT